MTLDDADSQTITLLGNNIVSSDRTWRDLEFVTERKESEMKYPAQ